MDARADAQTFGGGGDIVGADLIGEACGHRIDRLGQRRLQGDFAEIFAGIVARHPIADGHRLIDHLVFRGAANLHGGQIDEGFKGGARLSARV